MEGKKVRRSMPFEDEDTEALLQRIVDGDQSASQLLLARHRDRLKNMVTVRMDCRLLPRVDPSDVVQETLAEAWQDLSQYVKDRPIPFYPWLRKIAWDRLIALHARHIRAEKRSVAREGPPCLGLPDESAMHLAEQMVASGTSPSDGVLREELRARVRSALERMDPADREILVMRHLEQLQVSEIASVLGISEGAVKMRRLRAAERLRELLEDSTGGGRRR